MMMWLIVIIGSIYIQTDWTSGSGVLGPVTDWGKAFYQHDSITYNIQGQICPYATDVDYSTPWLKHVIDTDTDIENHSIWPADFDNDGDIDFAGWKGKANELVFYENDGNNNFTSVATYTGPNVSSWGLIYGADLDNNGYTDVVVPGGATGGLCWFQNNGGFVFTRHSIITGTGVTRVFVYGADIDNDNDTDLVVSRAKFTPVEIWMNDGTGGFTLGQTIGHEAWRIKFADLNNDGWSDMVIGDCYAPPAGSTPARYRVYLNDGAGSFNPTVTFANDWGNDALWIRDMDNDDDLDIICGVLNSTASPTSIPVWWMENDGTGTGWSWHEIYSGGDVLFGDGGCAEDFDFDGLTDVATGWRKLSWFRQLGPDNFVQYVIDAPSSLYTHWIYPMRLGGGTCFKSGNVDLLVCWTGRFVWYENQMINEFAHGWLTSSILELDAVQQRQPLWFGWEACVPAESTLAFYWRADSTSTGIGSKPWIGPHYSIVGETIRDSIDLSQVPCYRYFQCKSEFWPSAGDVSVVYEAWLSDTACPGTGAEEQNAAAKEPFDLRIVGTDILLSVNEPVRDAGLYVYNIAGELVETIHQGRLEARSYRFTPGLRASGIYFVVLKSSRGTRTAKFVRLR